MDAKDQQPQDKAAERKAGVEAWHRAATDEEKRAAVAKYHFLAHTYLSAVHYTPKS